MADIEVELRALRRVPAPQGFTGGVMQEIARRRERQRRRVLWAAAAAMLCAALLGPFLARRYEERSQALRAQRQFAVAMRVTAKTIFEVQQQIGRVETRASEGER